MGVIKGHNVTLIAESSTTRTEWSLIDNGEVLAHAYTQGLNPFFMTRREISHSIRLELPPEFFKRRWNHVYFYGAGCSGPEKNKIIEGSLVAQFKTPVTVMSDLLGAARALFGSEPGIACILGTGSNSGLYDGAHIVKNTPPLGFILGDEGSGATLGRLFAGSLCKGLMPQGLLEEYLDFSHQTVADVIQRVYRSPLPNRYLAGMSTFIHEHLHIAEVHDLVVENFRSFFRRNLVAYESGHLKVRAVGSIAYYYREQLNVAAQLEHFCVDRVERSPMKGLVEYHARS